MTTNAKILVVEDDPSILEVLGIALTSEGHSFTPLKDPTGLISQIQQEKPDVILLDLMMKNVSTINPLVWLRSNPTLKSKVVLMSAHADLPHIAEEHGVDYLSKPFSLDELTNIINRNIT